MVGQINSETIEEYVKSPAFDEECQKKIFQGRHISSEDRVPSIGEFRWEYFSNYGRDSTNDVHDYMPYEVPEYEAIAYYLGVGARRLGPRLIYRTSDDGFAEPSGPEAYARYMRIIAVPDSHIFGQSRMWDSVRDEVVKLLDQRNIKVTSVDFVQFRWSRRVAWMTNDVNNDDDALPNQISGGYRYTNPTIWIGVLPETLSGADAHEVSKDILAFLDSLQVQQVDIAYRESVCKTLHGDGHGPALFRPVVDWDKDSRENVLDNVSTAVGLPIVGCRATVEGTLGPYFRVDDKLYAITARHNVSLLNGDNEEYRYDGSAPKKEIMVMDDSSFKKYRDYVQSEIGSLIRTVGYLESDIDAKRGRMQDGSDVQALQTRLKEDEAKLVKTRMKIDDLKKFFIELIKRWAMSTDRIIGFVRWAPPIGVGAAPHRYNRDLCVLELYKDKFKHMLGNVLKLDPELSPIKRASQGTASQKHIPHGFMYPWDGLLPLKAILTVDEINNTPDTSNPQGNRARRVLKTNGSLTKTTFGTLSRYMSFTRKYFPTGTLESLEVPIISNERVQCGSFAKEGDSGSIIVHPSDSDHETGEFVALLTGGTASHGTEGADIAYATPFEWVWELVKEEFPHAELDFNNLEEFLADVAEVRVSIYLPPYFRI